MDPSSLPVNPVHLVSELGLLSSSRQRRSHSSGPTSSIWSLASPNEIGLPRIGVV